MGLPFPNVNLADYIPGPIKNFLSGHATVITSLLMVVTGVLCEAGVNTAWAGITPDNAPTMIYMGLVGLFVRRAVAKLHQAVTDMHESIVLNNKEGK